MQGTALALLPVANARFVQTSREREPGKPIIVKQNDCGCVCSVHLIPPLPFG